MWRAATTLPAWGQRGWLAALTVVGTTGVMGLRRWGLRWGATDAERRRQLPGDEVLTRADTSATRAISIAAAEDQVWPWVAQLGQAKGGFYSYDWLENVFGCRIHSADRIFPEWQDVALGQEFHLHPDSALSVARVEEGVALVVRSAIPPTGTPEN